MLKICWKIEVRQASIDQVSEIHKTLLLNCFQQLKWKKISKADQTHFNLPIIYNFAFEIAEVVRNCLSVVWKMVEIKKCFKCLSVTWNAQPKIFIERIFLIREITKRIRFFARKNIKKIK